MQLLDPFKTILDPDLLSQEVFLWLEDLGEGVGAYFTTPGKEIPRLLGIITCEGWVVKHPISLDYEEKKRKKATPLKKITKITTLEPENGEALQASLNFVPWNRQRINLSLEDQDGEKAVVLILEVDSLERAEAFGSLATGTGDTMAKIGVALDREQFLWVCRD